LAKDHPFAVLYWDMADGKRKLSFRSKEGGVDVAEIAKRFGGGGHAVSSGAIVESGGTAITNHPDLWK
jgi:nanoRNase/pAp phosphatase (c-di-AMP/oligoRNAs hydrolase)